MVAFGLCFLFCAKQPKWGVGDTSLNEGRGGVLHGLSKNREGEIAVSVLC